MVVVVGGVPKVGNELRSQVVVALKLLALILVAAQVRVSLIDVAVAGERQIELFRRRIRLVIGSSDDEPSFFPLLPGVKEFILRIGAAAEVGVRHRQSSDWIERF